MMVADILYRRRKSNVPNYYVNQSGPGLQYASQATLAASTFPTTITLVQDGSIAGGVPTQTYGQPFRAGDIPAGHAPSFKVGSVTWRYSHGLQTYWPDGSLKWFAYALLPPAGLRLARGAVVTVTISDGGAGAWPAASRRTLGEVYAQGLVVNGITPTTPITNNGRNVNLYAALANDGNNYYAVKDMDGAAGARWTIKTKMTRSVGNTGRADTQLVVTHRVFAMNNASGELGGFRWFGEIRNPFYASGARTFISFQPPSIGSPSTGLNWSINPGGGGAVFNPVWFPFNNVDYYNGARFTGSITGDVLTVTNVDVGQLLTGTTVTASYDPASTILTITDIGANPIPLSGFKNSWVIFPDGTGNDLNQQLTSTEPNGTYGGRGTYWVGVHPASGFKNRILLASNHISSYGAAAGIHDGKTLTGQYDMSYQISASNGDAPGLRGTYRLSASVPSPISSESMTYWSNQNLQSKRHNDYWSGGQAGNILPGMITETSLPPVNAGTIPGGSPITGRSNSLEFFACDPLTSRLTAYSSSFIGYEITYTEVGTGSFVPLPAVSPYTRFQIATKDGKYNFFQGTGSITADTTLRAKINQAYWQSTGLFMPMDMSLIGKIPDTGYNWDWNPYNVGAVRTAGIDDYGPPIEVGLMCTFCGWDFYVQSAKTEKENRIFGLSGGTLCCDFKSNSPSSFDRLPPMNGPGVRYAGLPATIGGTEITPGPYGSPPRIAGSGLSDPTHEPNFWYWAFLRFGELQYFDYGVEWANCVTGYQQWSGGAPSPPYPYKSYGNVMCQGQYRGIGWANRDIQQAAFVCSHDPTGNPANPVFSDGSELQRYLLEHADDQPRLALAQLNAVSAAIYGSQAAADYAKRRGLWQPNYNSSLGGVTEMQEWEMAYICGGMMPAVLRGNADATAFITAWMSFCDHIGNHSIHKGNSANGYLHLYRISNTSNAQPIGTYGKGNTNPAISTDGQFAGTGIFFGGNSITWVPNTSGGNAFTVAGTGLPGWNGADPQPGYVLANGDIICVYAQYGSNRPLPVSPNNAVPGELTQNEAYYIRDLSPTGQHSGTWTFNLTPLAAGPNGPPIRISEECKGPGMNLDDHLISSHPSIADSKGPDYICQVANTINWLHAIATDAKTNAFARFT